MHEPRFDVAPLPITELAPIRFDSSDPDEPFVLGSGRTCLTGRCGLALAALQPGQGNSVSAAGWPVLSVITPCGVVRTARIGDVQLTERVALLAQPAVFISQWTVDRDSILTLPGGDTFALPAGATLTLAPGLPAGAAPDRAFRATAASVTRVLQHGLRVVDDGPVGRAVAWATARLALHAGEPDLPMSLAAITFHPYQVRPAPAPLLAARYAAATGDLTGLAPFLDRLRDAAAEPTPPDDVAAVAQIAGLTELQRTAVDFGEHAFAAALRGRAKRAASELAARPLTHLARAVQIALRVAGPGTQPPHWTATRDVVQDAWQTWAELELGMLAEAIDGWRRLLDEADAPVRGAWPARFGDREADGTATALFLNTFAHGLLGIEPDAPRHRLRIRPRILPNGGQIAIDRIRCGDASVTLEVQSGVDEIELRVRQDEGAIPLTALLEPVVAAPVAAVFVDAHPASLNIAPLGTGTLVPVQLVLDEARSLTIRLRPSPR